MTDQQEITIKIGQLLLDGKYHYTEIYGILETVKAFFLFEYFKVFDRNEIIKKFKEQGK